MSKNISVAKILDSFLEAVELDKKDGFSSSEDQKGKHPFTKEEMAVAVEVGFKVISNMTTLSSGVKWTNHEVIKSPVKGKDQMVYEIISRDPDTPTYLSKPFNYSDPKELKRVLSIVKNDLERNSKTPLKEGIFGGPKSKITPQMYKDIALIFQHYNVEDSKEHKALQKVIDKLFVIFYRNDPNFDWQGFYSKAEMSDNYVNEYLKNNKKETN